MEKQKSKIQDLLKKLSSESFRAYKQTPTETPTGYPVGYLTSSSKKSGQTSPFKESSKFNFLQDKSTPNLQKYLMNKTAISSPFDSSLQNSYLMSPTQNSMQLGRTHGVLTSTQTPTSPLCPNSPAVNKLRKQRMTKSPDNDLSALYKHNYPSTEDETVSEQSVKVQFMLGKKKIGEKKFYSFQSMEEVKKQMIALLKLERQSISGCYGMIGLDPVPYNHGLRLEFNRGSNSMKTILDKNIKEVSIQPILVEEKPTFENIDLSHFQLLKFLGSGGFSNVYLAKCQIDQKICALKFIKKESITSAKKAKMLENEKQILFTIDSPNLVDLLYAFQTPNYIVFGLEYCENGNLYNFLQKHKRIPEAEVKAIFKQILEGLEYLHENNILFRDLKLQNILFDQKGKVKITDFGLSKPEVSEQDITYSYCGSPEYMAPQMLAKCGHSFKVDYYALGIILYELLYGRSPFYAPKKQDIFMAIMNSEPRFPKEPMVSKEVKDLIKGLLIKDPERRIGSLKGIKQIKAHPWLRGPVTKHPGQSFQYQNLKISSKEMREIAESFKFDMFSQGYKKYFFHRSFVNRKAIEQIQQNLVVFEKKKQKVDKMVKTSSRHRFNK